MDLHNTAEDIILSKVTEIFGAIEKDGNKENFCTCNQCRMDTACYVLNRTQARYIVSNRGVARVEQETIKNQQYEADVATLIYEGIKKVNHNQRSPIPHENRAGGGGNGSKVPVYNIPTIVGRLFNGLNFSPVSGVKVELYGKGDLVPMKDANWQNPYNLVSHTDGTFTFWPSPVPAEVSNNHKIFEYTLRVESPGFETLTHVFKIPVVSDADAAASFSLGRTVNLPDLYMFPPGDDDDDGLL